MVSIRNATEANACVCPNSTVIRTPDVDPSVSLTLIVHVTERAFKANAVMSAPEIVRQMLFASRSTISQCAVVLPEWKEMHLRYANQFNVCNIF